MRLMSSMGARTELLLSRSNLKTITLRYNLKQNATEMLLSRSTLEMI